MSDIPTHIFKRYDIRGIAETELTDDFAYKVANAFVRKHELTEIYVGCDVRESSPRLAKAAIKGIRDAGCNVIDLGIISTSRIKWTVAERGKQGAVQITASHNPPEYNGFKFYLKGGLPFDQVNGMHELIDLLDSPKTDGKGTYEEVDELEAYIEFLKSRIENTTRHVFVDPSAGAACREVKSFVDQTAVDWVLYNAEEDAQFKTHAPNPVDPDATEAARDYCGMNKCIGAVLDADADRIVLIDEDGKDVPADYLGAWLATHLLSEGKGVTRTVRDSMAISDVAKNTKAHATVVPVGNAIVQREMLDKSFTLGIEKSGHIFFEDAHYAEAPLLCLIYTVNFLGDELLSDAIKEFRENYFSSVEHNVRVTDKQAVLQAARTHYEGKGELRDDDGILCWTENWWVSIRPSNTEPLMRLTWESKDQDTFNQLREEVLNLVDPFLDKDAPQDGH